MSKCDGNHTMLIVQTTTGGGPKLLNDPPPEHVHFSTVLLDGGSVPHLFRCGPEIHVCTVDGIYVWEDNGRPEMGKFGEYLEGREVCGMNGRKLS